MFAAFLVVLFVGFILLGVPIAFSLGFVSFVGIASSRCWLFRCSSSLRT